ncbi:MAG TPA: hypothetical protein PL031_05285, partial [Neisseria sp.]|nr:hypothetical protein [Neisseria sp.]
MNQHIRREIFERFRAANPHPTTELQYNNPFELLIAVLLSAQATDAGVNKATAKLFPVAGTPQAMLDAGYQAVGKDFPVFLHPETHDEYALARTERKSGVGYTGFAVHAAPDVTLEEDLARRDLTINAIAAELPWLDEGAPAGSPRLIDPYGGQRDLAAKVLRHVTGAFREDPVRILRVARFAARYADFVVAPETLALMREMVAAGEVDHLVPERVWQELSRGLMEAKPSRMFEVLRACG